MVDTIKVLADFRRLYSMLIIGTKDRLDSLYLLNIISYIYLFSVLTIDLKSLLKKYALLFIIVFCFLFLGGI